MTPVVSLSTLKTFKGTFYSVLVFMQYKHQLRWIESSLITLLPCYRRIRNFSDDNVFSHTSLSVSQSLVTPRPLDLFKHVFLGDLPWSIGKWVVGLRLKSIHVRDPDSNNNIHIATLYKCVKFYEVKLLVILEKSRLPLTSMVFAWSLLSCRNNTWIWHLWGLYKFWLRVLLLWFKRKYF